MQIHSVVVVRCTVYECGDESPLDDSRTQQQTSLYQLLPLHIRILVIPCMMVDSSKLWGYLNRLWHVLHWRRDWNIDSYKLYRNILWNMNYMRLHSDRYWHFIDSGRSCMIVVVVLVFVVVLIILGLAVVSVGGGRSRSLILYWRAGGTVRVVLRLWLILLWRCVGCSVSIQ